MSYDTAAADPDISQTGNETQLDSSGQPHSQVSPAPVIDHLQYVQNRLITNHIEVGVTLAMV